MQTKEWTNFWHHPQCNVRLLHAYYVQHAYPRHSHDYYVISVIERGHQSFTHRGTKHLTSPGGVILINPEAVHTGEAVDQQGFEMRSIYPTTAHMHMAVHELTGRHQALPIFREVRIYDRCARNAVISLHKAMAEGASALECEARFIWSLARLIQGYADISSGKRRWGPEKQAVSKARSFLEEHFMRGVSLQELAQHVALSPYYLLRVFQAEVGMPPYTYLESLRIRHAQQLLGTGKPLAEVAVEVGFSSQSHLTRQFKKIIGVTPGQYAQQVRPNP